MKNIYSVFIILLTFYSFHAQENYQGAKKINLGKDLIMNNNITSKKIFKQELGGEKILDEEFRYDDKGRVIFYATTWRNDSTLGATIHEILYNDTIIIDRYFEDKDYFGQVFAPKAYLDYNDTMDLQYTSYRKSSYLEFDELGRVVKTDELELEYDANDNLIKEVFFKTEGGQKIGYFCKMSEYDSKNNQVKVIGYNLNGETKIKKWYQEKIFDIHGNILSYSSYECVDENDQLFWNYKYSYSNSRLSKEIFLKKGIINRISLYEYEDNTLKTKKEFNDKGVLKSITVYDKNKLISTKSFYNEEGIVYKKYYYVYE